MTSNPYTVTILNARYGGTYEGGQWVALPCDSFMVPYAAVGGDTECSEFFCDPQMPIGAGGTPQEAADRLSKEWVRWSEANGEWCPSSDWRWLSDTPHWKSIVARAETGLASTLPAAVLATIGASPYLSSACGSAVRLEYAASGGSLPIRPSNDLHRRCRLKQEFTAEPCVCPCHKTKDEGSSSPGQMNGVRPKVAWIDEVQSFGASGELQPLASAENLVPGEEDFSVEDLGRVLLDLDRCQHGRHAKDNCYGCPGEWSTGNLVLPPGTLVGHDLYGGEIRVPEDPKDFQVAQAWQVNPRGQRRR